MASIIERTCIVTRVKKDVSQLFRVVKTKSNEVYFDKDHSILGRGVYICKDIKIIEKAKKCDSLSKGLKTKVSLEIYDLLINEMNKGGN